MTYNIHNTISFGGAGDAYIVLLKLIERIRKSDWAVRHLHVESNGSVPILMKDLYRMVPSDCMPVYDKLGNLKRGVEVFEGACDKKYQKNFKRGKYKGREILNTTFHGKYDFPGNDDGLGAPFIDDHKEFSHYYDVAIQCSAGAKGDRDWKFNPFQLKKILDNKGYKVLIIGKDERFEDINDQYNYVGSELFVNIGMMLSSKVFVGLSGLMNYIACSHKQLNVHCIESEDHNNHYLHPGWKQDFRYEIKYGSLQEVLAGLRRFKIL